MASHRCESWRASTSRATASRRSRRSDRSPSMRTWSISTWRRIRCSRSRAAPGREHLSDHPLGGLCSTQGPRRRRRRRSSSRRRIPSSRSYGTCSPSCGACRSSPEERVVAFRTPPPPQPRRSPRTHQGCYSLSRVDDDDAHRRAPDPRRLLLLRRRSSRHKQVLLGGPRDHQQPRAPLVLAHEEAPRRRRTTTRVRAAPRTAPRCSSRRATGGTMPTSTSISGAARRRGLVGPSRSVAAARRVHISRLDTTATTRPTGPPRWDNSACSPPRRPPAGPPGAVVLLLLRAALPERRRRHRPGRSRRTRRRAVSIRRPRPRWTTTRADYEDRARRPRGRPARRRPPAPPEH
mmetsp:Transcript_1379/g.5332  ORF Transcript_1379/g.5332 Transcript_1379/m.5332 type:complete len:349 (+) Transcript_1379:624-1670(+)